jgi:Xaa-Pro aminopeptidase
MIDEQITAARARRPGFVSPSFGTIAGFNANGAIMHYRATPESHAVIEGDGLLLIDSGGQYLGGTTDITRVVPVGTYHRRAEARLHAGAEGDDGLSVARFPRGTKGRCWTRWRARRSGPPASTTATAPATASATS